MRPARSQWLAIAGVVTFLAFLVTGLPARVAARWLMPAGVQITDVDGSLWRGSAAAVTAGSMRLGPLSWSLSATALLSGHARANVQAMIGSGEFSGTVDLSATRRFVCLECRYEGPAGSLQSLVPVLAGLEGSLHGEVTVLEIANGWPLRIVATLKFSGVPLRIPGAPVRPGMPTASFEISTAADPVPDDGLIEALILDAGGPVQLSGQLAIRPPGNYELSARVKPRADAPREVTEALVALGARGPDGSTDIGLSGSF